MICRDVQGLSGNYLDGELPEEMCDRVQRHLLRCGGCREEIETLRMAVDVLKAAHAAPVLGEELIQRMLGVVGEELGISTRSPEAPGQLVLSMREPVKRG